MRHASPRRKIVLLLLAALLIAPWASAAPRHGSAHPVSLSKEIGAPDFLSRAWNLLAGAWTKTGCHIDPDGQCGSASVAPNPLPTKEGCQIDPSGRCNSGSSSVNSLDTGCQIDPGGRCKS
jgi:hypothetical protein